MLKPIVKALIVALGVISANDVSATKLQFPSPKATLASPNANGDHLYFVLLRVDLVRELGDVGEAPPIPPSEVRPFDDSRAWHRADARKMVRLLEGEYGFSATTMTSWIAPSLTAYLSEKQLAALDADPRVDTIELVTASTNGHGNDFSSAPPWSDVLTSGEEISYGKVAMDMNDNVTPGTTVYMIDAGMDSNGLAHVDLDGGFLTTPGTGTSNCVGAEVHAAAVASVLSAEHGNSAGIKGVNNAGPIISVSKGCTSTDVHTAMDWAVGDMESKGINGVINLSANSADYIDGTSVAQFMRKASARALVVQSAGNQNGNACSYAYSPAINGDGMLVVGGVDSSGAQATPFDESEVSGAGATEPGSNYGTCVEVWAPGQLIWVDYADGTSTSKRLRWSGTSFSAPHVSAMAARYGTSTTNPVVREAFIRSKLFGTGHVDSASQSIKVPSYTQTPLFTIPSKLAVSSVSVTSTYLTNSGTNATDGNYLTTMWNSGVTPSYPSTQPYIQLDLGATKTLYSMRFMPAQSPSGTSTHDVYVGTTSPPTTFAGTITRNIMDGETMSLNLGGASARYVRLVTHSSPSWAAYYEVEVFGN
jgi:Subtilase family/F5/8 type C domain